jgi:hypothetical protein
VDDGEQQIGDLGVVPGLAEQSGDELPRAAYERLHGAVQQRVQVTLQIAGVRHVDALQGQLLDPGGGDRGLRRPPAQDRGLGDAAARGQLVEGQAGVAVCAQQREQLLEDAGVQGAVAGPSAAGHRGVLIEAHADPRPFVSK